MTTAQQIEALAYQIWEQEGRPQGRELDHWLRAQERLTQPEPAKPVQAKPAPLVAGHAKTRRRR